MRLVSALQPSHIQRALTHGSILEQALIGKIIRKERLRPHEREAVTLQLRGSNLKEGEDFSWEM